LKVLRDFLKDVQHHVGNKPVLLAFIIHFIGSERILEYHPSLLVLVQVWFQHL